MLQQSTTRLVGHATAATIACSKAERNKPLKPCDFIGGRTLAQNREESRIKAMWDTGGEQGGT
jgi:hypothetical protein